MAEIRPFRAWRYNQVLARNIGELTSPLFDVATDKQKSALYGNPYNSIHLSIPAGERPAENACEFFKNWKKCGCIQRDPDPGIYVYYQYFSLPGDPGRYCRRGFICKIRICDWDQKVILRHENTMPGSVAGQIELLAATHLNVSPTHGLYTDDAFELEKYMDESMQQPLCEAEDYQGIRDVLSVIRDKRIIDRFVRLMNDKQVILADGHHRYAGSLAYMQQQRAANKAHTGREAYNYHMMWLTNTGSRDLKILPTHRLIRGMVDFDEGTILKKLERYFFIRPVSNPQDMTEVIAGKKWTFGLIFPDSACEVRLKPEVHDLLKWNFPAEIRSLDLTVMHFFIIQEALGIKGEDQNTTDWIEYERSFAACLTRVFRGEAQLALITNDISIEDVKTVCATGGTLPQKSTHFWPKVICGFVFSSI